MKLINELEIEKEEEIDERYQKELMSVLIENENEKIIFQNTKNSVGISNTYRASSKMCGIM
jgi:hypothetical protein